MEVNVFAWVSNSLNADPLLNHLERRGFQRSCNIVFIPYSTKENWLETYPHMVLTMECDEDGRVVGQSAASDRTLQEEQALINTNNEGDGGSGDGNVERKKCRTGALLPGP